MNEGFTPTQLIHRDLNRLKGYKELLDFYHGRHWEGRAVRGEKRLTFNYAKVLVDKVTSYLMSGTAFAVDPLEDSDEARARAQRAEQALYQVYEDNNLEQLDFSPGYTTSVGNEVSPGQTYNLEAYEHTSSGGKAALILIAYDSWKAIDAWRARHQFRWNKAANELNVRDILAFVLARVGLNLVIASESVAISTYYPDFTINPNNRGDLIIRKLLSFVPDVLFIEGNKAYLVNPLDTDASVYPYATPQTADHPLLEGRYRIGAWELSRIQVEGDAVIKDSFAWGEISKLYDRFRQLYDRNLASVAQAQERGEAYLRQAEIEAADGVIRILVNCGQQLYDVIDITDSRAGLSAEKKRVLGLVLIHTPAKGQYEQRLALGEP